MDGHLCNKNCSRQAELKRDNIHSVISTYTIFQQQIILLMASPLGTCFPSLALRSRVL